MNLRMKNILVSRSLRACAALALLTVPAPARAVAHVGLVLDVTGEWVLYEGGKVVGKIERGQGLPDGGTVRPVPPGEGWIVILLHNDQVTRCEAGNLRDCQRPFGRSRKTSRVGRFYAAIVNLILSRDPDYESAAPRAPDQEGPREAVLSLDGGQVDLMPAFEHARAGRYRLLFAPVGRAAAGEQLTPVALNWKRGGTAKVAVKGLKPGLYRLLLLDATKDDEPSGAQAWVLVTDAAWFAKTSAAFGEASAWSRGWQARGSREAERIFHRAYLDNLKRTSLE